MGWEIEYADEFGRWWSGLNEAEQDDTAAVVGLLERRGPALDFLIPPPSTARSMTI